MCGFQAKRTLFNPNNLRGGAEKVKKSIPHWRIE